MLVKEFNFFKKRMLLISGIVAMLTILTSFLSGLTGGLAQQNISEILNIRGSIIIKNGVKTLTDSTISENDYKNLLNVKLLKVKEISKDFTPVGISQVNISKNSLKSGASIFTSSDTPVGTIILSKRASEELKISIGESIIINNKNYSVIKIANNEWYGHAPVSTINISDWRELQASMGNKDIYSTMLIKNNDSDNKGLYSFPKEYKEYSKFSILPLVGSFRSEIGSLALIIGMLLAISSFIVGGFIYIWNSQRKRDFAIIKALGGNNKTLSKIVLLQSLMMMTIGITIGLIITSIFGYFLSKTTIPYMLNLYSVFIPALLLLISGIIGSLFTLRSIMKSDPLEALEV